MIILGISGGFDLPYQKTNRFLGHGGHDSSATLLIDGEIVCAIEEERVSRIKHTNKFPVQAIKTILKEQNLELKDIDYFSYYASEEAMKAVFDRYYWENPSVTNFLSPRGIISYLLEESFQYKIEEEKVHFVDHHLAHAASTYYMSGFDKSLIVTLDGMGENVSGRVLYGEGNEMRGIDTFFEKDSLGNFYFAVTMFLGYSTFDEYKVMGLAPYGNPDKYRNVFSLTYKLLPEGKHEINMSFLEALLNDLGKPRRKGQEFGQFYKDVAASLQEALENIVFHKVAYHQKKSGFDKLCLAGGVAHNCSANGKIYYADLFKEVFVQPASNDAGCSIGSAISTYMQKSEHKKVNKLEHVFFGTKVEEGFELNQILEGWEPFIEYKHENNITHKVAELIADGKIVGWVQGRSEFGPRALGNRSILADPRPAENKDIVNRIVKKREAYRPFAPSVIHEKAAEYFEINTDGANFDYMTFVVKVKEAYQETLGAITHVDGTARIQTVNKEVNLKYWELINEFGKLTGTFMLLNTSFNNNVEPIVNSAEDAIVCYLTTGLDYLIIGDYLISKKQENPVEVLGSLVPKSLYHTVVYSKNSFDSFQSKSIKYEIGFNYTEKYNRPISKEVFELVSNIDGKLSLNDLIAMRIKSNGESRTNILNEINELWNLRFICLTPSYKLEKSFA